MRQLGRNRKGGWELGAWGLPRAPLSRLGYVTASLRHAAALAGTGKEEAILTRHIPYQVPGLL